MSHPIPGHDYGENEHDEGSTKKSRKKYIKGLNDRTKAAMAQKMFRAHGEIMKTLGKAMGGSFNLPPGYKDRDNE